MFPLFYRPNPVPQDKFVNIFCILIIHIIADYAYIYEFHYLNKALFHNKLIFPTVVKVKAIELKEKVVWTSFSTGELCSAFCG